MENIYKNAYEDILKDIRSLRHTIILETCQEDFEKLIMMVDNILRKEIETPHLTGLGLKVREWPTLPKNFNQKENRMQYMTNKMRQRFISELAKDLNSVKGTMRVWRKQAVREAIELGKSENSTRKFRDYLADMYSQYSQLQKNVKSNSLTHSTLQKMEKCVTWWIVDVEGNKQLAYEQYLENRYDRFYRNKSKQAKKKLAKLVELQQAIRKQKSITKD